MKDYSAYTKEDFNDLGNYDLYGFISDTSITGNAFYDRLKEVYEYADKLHCLDKYKFCADPLLGKRHFIDEWTVKDKIELLEDDIFHKLIELDELDRPKAEMLLREQAEKFKCKTEFNKKLKAVEKAVKLSNIQTIKPAELPFIKVKDINIMTGEIKYCVACPALAEYFRQHNHYFWIKSTGGTKPLRYLYESGVYRTVSDDELVGILRDYITAYDPELLKMRDAYEAFKNICCDNVFHNADELNADENIINFQNGILHLDTMELTEHSPALLSTIQIPYKWTDEAAPAPVLDSYIETLTEGDRARQKLIYAWAGLIMSNVRSRRFKRSLWLVGKPDSGKSKIIDLIAAILGADNCASIGLKFLEENRFSTSSLFGKRLAYCGDMSADPISDLSKFKDILGGKMIKFEFKGLTPFTAEFNGFFMFAMNDLPPLGRDSIDRKAIYNRITIIPCNNVIPKNKQDGNLENKLYAERGEFIRRCILSAVKVIRNGYKLPIPEASNAALEQYKNENSNVKCFLNECCEARTPNMRECSTSQVYDVYADWCKLSGYKPLNLSNFRKELSVQLDIPADEMIGAIHGVRFFKGIQLTSSAIRTYTQAYIRRAPRH